MSFPAETRVPTHLLKAVLLELLEAKDVKDAYLKGRVSVNDKTQDRGQVTGRISQRDATTVRHSVYVCLCVVMLF